MGFFSESCFVQMPKLKHVTYTTKHGPRYRLSRQQDYSCAWLEYYVKKYVNEKSKILL